MTMGKPATAPAAAEKVIDSLAALLGKGISSFPVGTKIAMSAIATRPPMDKTCVERSRILSGRNVVPEPSTRPRTCARANRSRRAMRPKQKAAMPTAVTAARVSPAASDTTSQ